MILSIFRETFGEGLHWAGLTIIALLKQQKRFDALDFASHILKVQEVDERQETVAGIVSLSYLIPLVFAIMQIVEQTVGAFLQSKIFESEVI